jgi:phage-related protein
MATRADKPLVWLKGELKKTPRTPLDVIDQCRRRLKEFDDA